MTPLATTRVINAAASLDAADRALLNLWLNRGLDDDAVARMTGMDVEAVAKRRERIVADLSDVLGLPPEDVRSALTEPSPPPEPTPASEPTPAPEPTPVPEAAAAPEPTPVTEPEPAAGPGPAAGAGAAGRSLRINGTAPASSETRTEPAARRRRRLWAVLAAAVIVLAVVIVSLGSGGSSTHRGNTASHHAGTAGTGASRTAATLAALPGSSVHGTGTVQVTQTPPNLTLNVSVSPLPAASHGHYEVWLYDSVVNSEDLGRLRNGVTRLSLRLPADASRYRWIDISFQPTGQVFHSGESQLRSVNPLFPHGATATP